MLPYALQIGLTENDLRYMTMKVFKIHANAYRDRLEREMRLRDENGWLQGRYFAQAIATCFSKGANYPEQPYLQDKDLRIEEKKELTQEEIRVESELFFANLSVMQANFERTHPKETN